MKLMKKDDPMWCLPLHMPYREMIESELHIDTSAWTKSTFAGPGKLEGEESLGSRALWRFVSAGYGRSQG